MSDETEANGLPNEGRVAPAANAPQPDYQTIPEQPEQPAWNWSASVNPPQRAAPLPPTPQEFIARLTRRSATARAQAIRFSAAAIVASEIGAEFARTLAAVHA